MVELYLWSFFMVLCFVIYFLITYTEIYIDILLLREGLKLALIQWGYILFGILALILYFVFK